MRFSMISSLSRRDSLGSTRQPRESQATTIAVAPDLVLSETKSTSAAGPGPPLTLKHASVRSIEPPKLPEVARSRDFVDDVWESLSSGQTGFLLSRRPSSSFPVHSRRTSQFQPDMAGPDGVSRRPSLLHHDIGATLSPAHSRAVDMGDNNNGGGNGAHDEEPPVYPSAAKTALIMFSLYISIFLVALDRTIIGPAIPAITNQFHSIDDIGWYGSAYMLTSCGFILLYGRIYTFYPIKWVFLCGIALFEIGSAVCGAATSSLVLIIGRAVSGVGSGGIFTGAILIMLNTVPLHRRPMLQGLFGACFGVASVAGPLLGGAFTGSSATWRWCFYINLPLGGFTMAVVFWFLKLKQTSSMRPKDWKDTVKRLDPVGTALFLPSITCLLLALEYGGDGDWHQPRIIALLTVFAVLFVLFIWWEYWTRNTTATVPARILFQRSVAFGGLSQFCVGSTMLTVSMYIPIWFQAIQDVSAIDSGINTIPLVLSVVVGSISSGALVQTVARGYYTPFMVVGSALMAGGTGILTTWDAGIGSSMWIGSQVMLGLGVGWTMQHPNLAVQVVLPGPDIPTGTALLSLFQTLGGAVFVAVGQNVFIDKFTGSLEGIQGIDPAELAGSGVTDLRNLVPDDLWQMVLDAYNESLTQGPFFAALIVACLAVPAALGMEWRSVKEEQREGEKKESDQGESQQQSEKPAATAEGAGEDRPRAVSPEVLSRMSSIRSHPEILSRMSSVRSQSQRRYSRLE